MSTAVPTVLLGGTTKGRSVQSEYSSVLSGPPLAVKNSSISSFNSGQNCGLLYSVKATPVN